MADRSPQVISVRLNSPEEMFVLAQTDLFSEYRNFLTGMDYCISELRSRRTRVPVRIEIALPAAQIEPGTDERIARTMGRYCNHRITYNERERRAVRFDGLSSLFVGVPLAVIGIVILLLASWITGSSQNPEIVLDSGGWILVWVAVWFPLDTLLFTPLGYGRENRVLALLRDAEIRLTPFVPVTGDRR